MLVQYMKEKLRSCIVFQMAVLANIRTIKTFSTSVTIKDDVELDAECSGYFFASSHGKCDAIGGFVKRFVAKRILQRPLNNQILNYKDFLEVYKK